MKDKVREILTDLERVRENLLALSDDIWLSIDHNDMDALQEGVAFKAAYNDKMARLNGVATELSALISQFTDVPVETPVGGNGRRNGPDNERITRELDREAQHTLAEDFQYTRPYGFVLQGQAYKEIVTWRRLYELLCRQLAAKDAALFARLPSDPDYTGKRGTKAFSAEPHGLNVPMQIAEGVYAEGNLSANSIRDRMRKLLRTFGIAPEELVLYLREDRDAA